MSPFIIGQELYRSIYILCNMKRGEVLELNVEVDHVHLVVIIPPKVSLSTLMGTLKRHSESATKHLYARSSVGVVEKLMLNIRPLQGANQSRLLRRRIFYLLFGIS